MSDQDAPETTRLAFDIKQAEIQHALARERLAFEKEVAATDERLRQREIELKERDVARSPWVNPLFLAVVAAAIGLFGNAYVAYNNTLVAKQTGEFNRALEDKKHTLKLEEELKQAEQERLRDAVMPINGAKRIENLRLLIALGLYRDDGFLNDAMNQLESRPVSAAPTVKDRLEKFDARSNGTATFRKCISPSPHYHFESWNIIDKQIIGDGNAWFEKQTSSELCVRADASVTAGGRNSSVDAVLTAKEVPD